MSFLSAIRVALDALMVNKGRSILTSLGIVIGIMAVIAMVAAGNGARQLLDDRLISVGKNLILIQPGGRTAMGIPLQSLPLTTEDAQALRDDPQLKEQMVGIAETQQQVVLATNTLGINHYTSVVGSVPSIINIRKWTIAPPGRPYDDADVKQRALVCLIGETVRQKLFPHTSDPTGEKIKVNGIALRIIGLLGKKGRAPNNLDQDNQIFVPITTLQEKIAGEKHINIITAAAISQEVVPAAKARIERIFSERHRIREGMEKDFEVRTVEEMAQIGVILTDTLNVLVIVIASISLIVGGIGIMNIMLVSVTERTREIGIRMAVGATTADIRNQFLIEAVILALVGGLIGVSLGLLAAASLNYYLRWPVEYSPFYVSLAFGVSAAVGVFFGYYPAVKASLLDPIEALRYE